MKLTILGCSGSYPGPNSSASSYLLEYDDNGRTWRLLIDLGSGALSNLQRIADPLSIDTVLLSHLHADHCLDMCGYYVLRKYHPTGTQPILPVYGPVGTADRCAKAYDLPYDPGMKEEFDFRLYDGPFTVGPFAIEPFEVYHPVPAYALRITAGGKVFAYSGDTAPCAGVDAAAKDADLFLCEASFLHSVPNPPGVHLTGVEAGDIATRMGASRLIVTHVPPWYDPEVLLAEAVSSYAGPVTLARPEDTYDI